MTKLKFTHQINEHLELEFIAEKIDGELLDTEVHLINYESELTRSYIALISGSEINNFSNDFSSLISKYNI